MTIETRKGQFRTLGSLIGRALFGTTEELQETGAELLHDVEGQVRARRAARSLEPAGAPPERRRPLNAPAAPVARAAPARRPPPIVDAEVDDEEPRR